MKTNYLELFASANTSKNLNYDSLYKFVGANTKQEKKDIRKKIQNLELSHLNKTFINVLIESKFFEANKQKEKFSLFVTCI